MKATKKKRIAIKGGGKSFLYLVGISKKFKKIL